MTKLLFLLIKNFIFKHKIICFLISFLLMFSLFSVFLISAIIAGVNENNTRNYLAMKRYTIADNSDIFTKSDDFKGRADKMLDEINDCCAIETAIIKNEYQEEDVPYGMCIFGNPPLYRGRGFTVQETENLQNKIIVSNLLQSDLWLGDVFKIFEKEYEVIGLSFETVHLVPFDSQKLKEANFDCFEIVLKKAPLDSEGKEISRIIDKYFPECVAYEPIPNKSKFDPLLIILFFGLFVVTVINVLFIYDYIIEERTKTIRIMRICGATSFRCVCLFIFEMLMFTTMIYAPTSIASVFMLPELLNFVTDGNLIYVMDIYDYIIVFFVYVVTILLIFLPKIYKVITSISVTSFER